MTSKEKEALQGYIKHEKESGRIPSLDTAIWFIMGWCGYLEGFANEFEKEVKK